MRHSSCLLFTVGIMSCPHLRLPYHYHNSWRMRLGPVQWVYWVIERAWQHFVALPQLDVCSKGDPRLCTKMDFRGNSGEVQGCIICFTLFPSRCLLHNSPMLVQFFVVVGLLFQMAITVSPSTCEEKGFASSLLCSSCDKLSAFVGDSGISIQHMLLIV